MARETQSEDAAKRFEAIEWSVQTIDGNDMQAFLGALEKAKAGTGKPHLIIARTLIGKGIPEVAGTAKAHGEGGAKFVDAARKAMGLPENEHFFVSQATRDYFAEHGKKLAGDYAAWQKTYEAWRAANPALAGELDAAVGQKVPADLLARIPQFPADAKIATRKAGSDVLQAVAEAVPYLIGGSADLYGSTLNYINSSKDFNATNHGGRNIRFGIREHGMCGILNGLAYDGIFRPSGATFLVFADYCRPSIRLAALSGINPIYIFTHDSVGVGEDGPTHQPVETVSGLRIIPNLDVIRPADPRGNGRCVCRRRPAHEWPHAARAHPAGAPELQRDSRANPPRRRAQGRLHCNQGDRPAEDDPAQRRKLELQHAVAAAKQLGEGVRVVSVPSFHRFDSQPQVYKDEVLPPSCRRRVAIEAGVSARCGGSMSASTA